MDDERRPSEIILDYIDFLEESKRLYDMAKEKCESFDSAERHIYWAHKFELAKDKAERNRLATAYQKERRERRRYKNICDKYKTINDFVISDNNKGTLKRMKGMVVVQKRQEDYLGNEKTYKGDANDNL